MLQLPEVEFNILLECGRIKVSDITKIIIKIVEEREASVPERKAHLVEAIKEFDRLSQIRNQYVHWLWGDVGLTPAIMSIKPKAKPETPPKFQHVTVVQLNEATSALLDVNAVLCQFLKGAADPDTLELEKDYYS